MKPNWWFKEVDKGTAEGKEGVHYPYMMHISMCEQRRPQKGNARKRCGDGGGDTKWLAWEL